MKGREEKKKKQDQGPEGASFCFQLYFDFLQDTELILFESHINCFISSSYAQFDNSFNGKNI